MNYFNQLIIIISIISIIKIKIIIVTIIKIKFIIKISKKTIRLKLIIK